MKLFKSFSKLAIALTLLVSSVAFADMVVIVSAKNANYGLDKIDIEQIFLGKKSAFPDGAKAVPVDQNEDSAVRTAFNDKVLGKTSGQLKAYWSRLIFTGKGTPPKEAGADADIVKLVADDPSLVGYVSASAVNGSVKVVFEF